jgi:Opacity protein and related surface antigens
MRTLVKAASLVFGALAISAPLAQAADMPIYEPIIETPDVIPLEAAGGWYLRGDIGYKIYDDPKVKFDHASLGSVSKVSLDDTWMIGVGAGYKMNDYFRADVTLDYEFQSDFKGTVTCVTGCTGATAHAKTDLEVFTTLVNAYVDLGTYSGITPYVGGGIGAAYLKTGKITSDLGKAGNGDDQWNFAWALTAGASYAFTDRLALDVNYRYLNLGEASLGKVTTPCLCEASAKTSTIDAHEIRVGLRYTMF